MISLKKGVLITFSSQILIFTLGLVSSIILARVLGPIGNGIYALIILIPAVMLKLGSFGIESANIYFTGSKQYEIQDIVSSSLLKGVLLGSLLISLFFVTFHLDIFKNFIGSNQIDPFYLWIVVLTVPLSLFSEFILSIILGIEKIIIYNKINIFRSGFQLVAITVFLLIFKKGVLGAVLSYVLGVTVLTGIVIFIITKFAKISFSFSRTYLKESTKYGLKVYLGNLAQFLNYRLDMFLIAAFLTPAAVGFYTIAVGIAERLWILPGAIATVLFPKVSSLKDTEADNLTPRIARHTFLIMSCLSLILALLARPLIKILFGSVFLPSVMPLLILLPGIIALGISKILTVDLAGRGKPQFGTYAAFASLAINIPLNIWLIPKWGISGAAFASSIAYITATVIVIIAFAQISDKSWIAIFLFNRCDIQDYKNIAIKLSKKGKMGYYS